MDPFGPGLSQEEQKRRVNIVTRIGMGMLGVLVAFILFVALDGLVIFKN